MFLYGHAPFGNRAGAAEDYHVVAIERASGRVRWNIQCAECGEHLALSTDVLYVSTFLDPDNAVLQVTALDAQNGRRLFVEQLSTPRCEAEGSSSAFDLVALEGRLVALAAVGDEVRVSVLG